MAITHTRAKRKATGGRYIAYRGKRKFELASNPTFTVIGKKKSVQVRTIGKNLKFRLLRASEANLYDPKAKTYSKAVIKTVLENAANRHYARRGILTKGTIVETDKGKARIVNSPGQENTINAVLI